MIYSKTPFENVKEEVEKIFPNSIVKDWNLLPNDIHKLAEGAGVQLQWNKIDWWEAFEYRRKDVDEECFYSLLFTNTIAVDSELIVVTDECFKDENAYGLQYNDLAEFCETIYPEMHNMEFFQPHDFIFILSHEKQISMLHHEGFWTQYRK